MPKIKKKCELCGKTYWVTPHRLSKTKFCSLSCNSKNIQITHKKNRTCFYSPDHFIQRLGGIHGTKSQKKNKIGIFNPEIRREAQKKAWESTKKNKTGCFLDRELMKKIHAKIKKEKRGIYNPAFKETQRKNAYKTHKICKEQNKSFWSSSIQKELSKRSIQTGWRERLVIPKKDTSIEVKIQNFLKTLGIEFFTHQYMKIEHGYQCDILIPSMNLVIECDGNYWHKYPVGLEKDHIRTKELIEKGFKVLRLWENEIRLMKINDFKERLKFEDGK